MTQTIFDADSHIMETPEWLPDHADAAIRDRLDPLPITKGGAAVMEMIDALPAVEDKHRNRSVPDDVLAGAKGWFAPGALDREVRSRVLDKLDIAAQLVFPTFSLGHFAFNADVDVVYGGTTALNRAMTQFCADDDRLKAVGFLSLREPERALAALDEALAMGVSAVWVPSDVQADFSPAHVDLEPVWARLADAGVPFVLHIGGGKLLDKAFHNNGQAQTTDWLGGGENLRAKDFPVMHHSPERFLSCLALDGVFERHPGLRAGVIELGASWVPGFLRNIDHAQRSFARHEPLVASLPLQASDYIRRQVAFTPFAFEDTAWLIDTCGPELFMFSTDYPHPEGGKAPFDKFGDAVAHFDDETKDRFFWRNGAEMLGLL